MSIEKIKERIRMIENNDFTTTGETINEVLRGGEEDMEQVFKANDRGILNKLMNKVKRGLHLSDRDQKLLYIMSKTDQNTRDIQQAADQLLRGGGATRVEIDSKTTDLPTKHETDVFKIYQLMKRHNILPASDLDPNTFKSKNRYLIRSTSSEDDTLVILNSKLISIQFNDLSLTDLVRMVIKYSNSFNQNDFRNFYNELNNNKSQYNVASTSITSGGKSIIINF